MAKSAEAFRTISEVAEVLDTPAHVLRFWESRFSQIKPVKRAGGRRYYRPADVALLAGIKRLLHDDGLTIRGVQKLLREQGVRHVAGIGGFIVDDDEAIPATPADGTVLSGPVRTESRSADAFNTAAAADEPVSPLRPDLSLGAEARAEFQVQIEESHRLRTPLPPSDNSRFADESRPPAAALLRAMTTRRAGNRRNELLSVYKRLSALYNKRLAAFGQATD